MVAAPCLLGRLGKREVEHVVRAARVQVVTLLGRHRVVRRSYEVGQGPGRTGVADGAEALHVGHPRERTNGQLPFCRKHRLEQ